MHKKNRLKKCSFIYYKVSFLDFPKFVNKNIIYVYTLGSASPGQDGRKD